MILDKNIIRLGNAVSTLFLVAASAVRGGAAERIGGRGEIAIGIVRVLGGVAVAVGAAARTAGIVEGDAGLLREGVGCRARRRPRGERTEPFTQGVASLALGWFPPGLRPENASACEMRRTLWHGNKAADAEFSAQRCRGWTDGAYVRALGSVLSDAKAPVPDLQNLGDWALRTGRGKKAAWPSACAEGSAHADAPALFAFGTRISLDTSWQWHIHKSFKQNTLQLLP